MSGCRPQPRSGREISRRLALAFSTATLGGCAAPPGSAIDELGRADVRLGASAKAGQIETIGLTFASRLGGRVPLRLIRSKIPPEAVIVFQHQLGESIDQFDGEAREIVSSCDAAALLIAAPFARPAPSRLDFDWRLPGRDAAVQRQALADLRALPRLARAFRLQTGRFGYVGHSYGANWGGILAGTERRYEAYVLIAGVGSVTRTMDRDETPWPEMRAGLGPRRFEQYRRSLRALDPERHVGRAKPGSIFFQFGARDIYVDEASARSFASRAGPTQFVRWYDVDHDFKDAESRRDRRAFLAQRLGLSCESS